MSDAKGDGCLSNEALVFLVRQTRNGDRDLFGRLIHLLGSRALRIAERWAQGFDRDTTNEIVWNVEKEILDLVLTDTPCRQSDFLEVAFGKAVERRTINAVQKRKQLPLPLRASFADKHEEETEPETPTELVADECPSPEEMLIALESEVLLPELIQKAHAAVKDRRHLEAVILRYGHDWPITDKDPAKPTLVRHFGVSEKQLRNWIKDALKLMRAAVGDSK